MGGSNPNFPVNTQAALQALLDAQRQLASLLAPGQATIQQSSRGAFEPFQTHRVDMLNNNNVYQPFKIGPHKSILYRGLVAVGASGDTPQAFTQNDYAYYLAGRKDADSSRWMVLQVGKSMEFDFPVDEGWIFIPNANRNPTFAIFETSVVGYIRSYQMNSGASAITQQDGSQIEPNAAVTVTTGGTLVAAGASPRAVTLYHQGGDDVWIGGAWAGGVGPNSAQLNRGIPLSAGGFLTLRNTSEISAISSGSANVSYIIEE